MKPARVLVLGHRGMLGHIAERYFRGRGFEVLTLGERFDLGSPGTFIDAVRAAQPDVALNAIGLIKQRESDPAALLSVNAALPVLLRLALPPEALLVQPSTDCVFSGTTGWYAVDAIRDATDAYGLSKILGETVASYPRTMVVRTSIVGPELAGGSHGLLGWFLSQRPGATVRGYTDHLWNGLTTLEWCKVVEEVLASPSSTCERSVIVQLGTERRWTKAEILLMFRETYRRDVRVEPAPSGHPLDRTLCPTMVRRPLEEQLRELAAFETLSG